MNQSLINLIAAGVFGGIGGGFIGFLVVRYKMAKDKQNALKMIEKQKEQDFMIPRVDKKNKDNMIIQTKVNLKEYCGIASDRASKE